MECGIIDFDSIVPMQPETISQIRRAIVFGLGLRVRGAIATVFDDMAGKSRERSLLCRHSAIGLARSNINSGCTGIIVDC